MHRNNYPRLERHSRQETKRRLRNKGIRPAKPNYVTCVETTAIDVPGWAVAKRFTQLSHSSRRVWFKGKSNVHARMLVFQDRVAGGRPEITRVEYRACPVCGRILLAMEAEARRKLDEGGPQGRKAPCNGECKAKYGGNANE